MIRRAASGPRMPTAMKRVASSRSSWGRLATVEALVAICIVSKDVFFISLKNQFDVFIIIPARCLVTGPVYDLIWFPIPSLVIGWFLVVWWLEKSTRCKRLKFGQSGNGQGGIMKGTMAENNRFKKNSWLRMTELHELQNDRMTRASDVVWIRFPFGNKNIRDSKKIDLVKDSLCQRRFFRSHEPLGLFLQG